MMRIVAVAMTLAASASCGFETRSQDFDCQNNGQCEDWQRCVDGSCIVAGTSCHPDCDECDQGICVMNCTGTDACQAQVICPPSARCRVNCTGSGSCRGGMDCSNANDCLLICQGADSCEGLVDCAQSDCDVRCTGERSCGGGVDCSEACACTTICSSSSGRTCVPECPDGNRCASGPNCTSETAGCNTCE